MRLERIALPYSGGVFEQPARDMEALAVLESVAHTVMDERMKERRGKDKRRARR